MKLLFASPGISESATRFGYPPWGAICGADSLRHEHDVEIRDFAGRDVQDILRFLASNEFDFVFWTGKIGKSATRLRQVIAGSPGVRHVVGGPLVTSIPVGHELWDGTYALIAGFAESLNQWFSDGCPKGFHDLRSAPFPKLALPTFWDGLADYVWPASSWPDLKVPSIHIAAGRGCTRRCSFCYLNEHQSRPRFRYVETNELFESFDLLNAKYGASGFYFVDDCFLDSSRNRVCEFEALNSGRNYRFGCDVQISDLANRGLLSRLARLGLGGAYVGIESGSESVRAFVGKARVTNSQLCSAITNADELGVTIRAALGFGWPGETPADADCTLRLITRFPRLRFDLFLYTPTTTNPYQDFGGNNLGHSFWEKSPELADHYTTALAIRTERENGNPVDFSPY
jgi:radical SAM superfamily enzyme YgiQ (UPF0313 family)